jgi:Phage capsid family.
MRKKYILSHQIENAEQLLGRLMRGAGMSDSREAWANRLIGMGDYPAAEQIRAATSTIAISDIQGFRETFSVVFQQLQTASVFDSILDDTIQAPIKSQIFSGDAFALFEVAEGRAIPFSSSAFEDLGELPLVKVGALLAFTIEFLRGLTAEVDNTLNNAFLRAIAAASDSALTRRLHENAGPATAASSSLADDIKNARQSILGSKAGRLHLIISPATAMQFAFATTPDGAFLFPNFDLNSGGSIAGLSVHVSDQIGDDSSGGRALLFDASRIAANRGSIDIQRSENAAVQMRDDPETGHATVVSSFQTNSVFIRILRTFGLKLPDEEVIAVQFSGVNNWFS